MAVPSSAPAAGPEIPETPKRPVSHKPVAAKHLPARPIPDPQPSEVPPRFVPPPETEAQVSEADIGKIQAGQKVNFTVTAYPNRTFTGTVAAVEPAGTTTSNVVTYDVLISVDKSDVTLLPSMTATVSIVTEENDNATLVPTSAISYADAQGGATSAQSGHSVIVLRNGQQVRVPENWRQLMD